MRVKEPHLTDWNQLSPYTQKRWVPGSRFWGMVSYRGTLGGYMDQRLETNIKTVTKKTLYLSLKTKDAVNQQKKHKKIKVKVIGFEC